MGAPRVDVIQQAASLAAQAAARIPNLQERKQFLINLGYNPSPQGGLGPPGFSTNDKRFAERVIAAVEASNPQTVRIGRGTVTQYDSANILRQLGETIPAQVGREAAEAAAEEQRPFRELAEAEEALRQQQAAYQTQVEEEKRLTAQYAAELKATEEKARIAGKRSVATSARARSQSQLEAVQLQQEQQKTALQAQQLIRTERTTGSSVGQPGRSRTRVSTGLGIGGYGGTAAGRVTSTGLNI